jgi:hypothetical protein
MLCCRMTVQQEPRRRPTGACVDDDFGPFFIKFCSYFP